MRHLYTWNYRLSLSLKITSGKAKGQTQEWSLNVTPSRAGFLWSLQMRNTEVAMISSALHADSLQNRQSQFSMTCRRVIDGKAETSYFTAQLSSAL